MIGYIGTTSMTISLQRKATMNIMKAATYEVKIYIGSREGYHGPKFEKKDLLKEIANFQTAGGKERRDMTSVRVTDTQFLAGEHTEKGWEIGIINYPRFSTGKDYLNRFAHDLAYHLLYTFKQNRMSIVMQEETWTLEGDQAEQVH